MATVKAAPSVSALTLSAHTPRQTTTTESVSEAEQRRVASLASAQAGAGERHQEVTAHACEQHDAKRKNRSGDLRSPGRGASAVGALADFVDIAPAWTEGG